MKRIRQGNTIHFRYSVYRSSGSLEEEEDLTGIEVTTSLQNRLYGTLVDVPFSTEGNVITGQIPGIPHLRTGVYNFCLSYQKDGTDFAVDTDAFQIVDSSSKTGGESACPHVEAETVEVKGVVEFGVVGSGGIEQVQADWKESNDQSKAFIRNKPVLKKVATSGSYKDLSDTPTIPAVSNDFTNEEKEKLQNIEGYVKDLSLVPTDSLVRVDISAYDPAAGTASTKSEFLNLATGELAGLMSALDKKKLSTLSNYDDTGLRTALQSEINRAKGVESSLDSAIEKVASDLSNFITGSPDADDIINRWQEVTAFLNGITEDKTLSGMLLDLKKQMDESVTVKLSDYYTSARVDELFVKKLVGSRLITEEEALKLAGLQNYDDTALVTALGTKVDKVEGKQLSSNDFTSELKTKLEGLTNFPDAPSDGKTYGRKDNAWEEVSTSGPAYTLPVATPTTLGGVKTGSNITNTEGTISIVKENVTGALGYTPVEPVEGKGLFSGSYNDLSDKPSIPVLPEGIVTDANYVHTDNNYTTVDKDKLQSLQNYDDTAIVDRVDTLEANQPVSIDVTDWYKELTEGATSPITVTQAQVDLLEAGIKNGIVAYRISSVRPSTYLTTVEKSTYSAAINYYLNLYDISYDGVDKVHIYITVKIADKTSSGNISQSKYLDMESKMERIPVTQETSTGDLLLYGNEYYKLGSRSTLTILLTYASELNLDFYYEYMFEFTASVDNMPLDITNADGSTVKWITEPDIKAGKTYQVSIVNNLAVIGGA